MAAVIAVFALFMFQRFPAGELVTHFIKGGNELINVIIMLSLIWAVTPVAENLGLSKYVTFHLIMDPSYVYCAVSFYTGGCYIPFYRVILGDLGRSA
ncbi:hypothetical protein ACT17G_04455 [Bacillus velezensis]|uniref:hypothetical protein n=1 Tax=Bacillus TaxID=1386 RepID=UPI001E5C9245|nr:MULTISPECIES: hypothetical protein [Bacillus]UFH23475.1 hypothetical protein LOK79_04470 [Bacillus velezensis]UUT18110.1 hypothetical protein NRF13_04565 [Bacillus velezensis]